ncbi:MAG: GAF domain-containing protein [Cyanobacteria bacterium HKST-UBA03]|nr:GAF domain-containing protein [Cyanobacteria bacterium HKST-UBA03]
MSIPGHMIPLSNQYPAAIVRPNGQVVRHNPLYSDQLADVDVLEIFQALHFSGHRSQVHVTPQGTLLKARLITLNEKAGPYDSDALLLEWTPMGEAEMRLAFFQIISKAVNASLILDEIFDTLAEEIQRFIPYASGTIVILDDTQNITKVVVKLDETGQAHIQGDVQEFVGYDSLMSDLLHQPQSLILHRQPELEVKPSLIADAAQETNLVVPLIAKGYVIGFINLAGGDFSPESINLLEDISEQLAVAVENARLYWQTQNQASREFLINHITKAIRTSLDIETILQTTVDEVGRVLGVSRCIISYWGRLAESADALAFHQCFQYTLPGISPIGNTAQLAQFEHRLFRNRQDNSGQYNPFVLNDVRDYTFDDGLFELCGLKSLAVFPIQLAPDGAFVGTISLQQCDTFRAWVSDDIDLLTALAEHMSVALHQANLFHETEQQRQQLEVALLELQQTQMHLVQSEKMAVLGQFVAGIAHEVNTPLGTIMANEDTVLKCIETLSGTGCSEVDRDKYKRVASDLLGLNRMATERIEEIVKNLRNFARLDESDMKDVDLHEGLEATLMLAQRSLAGHITVEKRFGNLPAVTCFAGLLNQVFLNLLVNAIQTINEKRERLPTHQGHIILTTTYDPSAESVAIAVTDNGMGIDEAHRAKVFDPGFTTKGVGVGTGLGLALCYKIVEKHHGAIHVESTVGHGTTMTVEIPVYPPKPTNS